MTDTTQVFIRPRQAGKTTRLIEWLMEGEPTNTWPLWSRVLLVHDSTRAQWVVKTFAAVDSDRREKNRPALAKLVLSYDDWRRARGRGSRNIQVAVDDADSIIVDRIGVWPDAITYTGEPMER